MHALALTFLSATLLNNPAGELLDFSSVSCSPCQQMAPLVDRLERKGWPIRKVDVQQNPELARKYNVNAIPAFVLVINGRKEAHIVGPQSEQTLITLMQRIPRPPVVDPVAKAAPGGQTPPSPKAPQPGAEASGVAQNSSNSASLFKPSPNQLKPFPGTAPTNPQAPVVQASIPPDKGAQIADAKPPASRPSLVEKFLGTKPAPAHPGREEAIRGNNSTGADDLPNLQDVTPLAASYRLRISDKGGTNYGTGTAIDSRIGQTYILTCGHIFRDFAADGLIEVDMFLPTGKETFVGKLVRCDLKADLGLISIPTDNPLPALPVAGPGEQLVPGEAVTSVGCGGGRNPEVQQHRILTLNRYNEAPNVQCTGSPEQGRSGGGLFSQQNQLIGICWGQDQHYHCGLYASLPAIHTFLDSCQLSRLYGRPDGTTVAEEAAPQLKESKRLSGLEQLKATLGDLGEEEVVCLVRSSRKSPQSHRIVILTSDK